MSTETVQYLLPELLLVLSATLIYVMGTFVRSRTIWSWAAAAALAAAGGLLFWQTQQSPAEDGVNISGPMVVDLLSEFVRPLAVAIGLLFVPLSARMARGPHAPEFMGSLLLIIAGTMFAGGSNELVLLFLGLELISIPTYILLYMGRRDAASQESATKYFFLSILSSAVLLYGFSFLYGVTGSTRLNEIAAAMAEQTADGPWRSLACLAMVLIFAGLGFRIAAAPFHFYAPDVYQGTTHVNAALLSVIPKVAGMVGLVRVIAMAMPGLEDFSWRLMFILSILTMTWGNVSALWQTNLRRLLAYSSIAHAGYMMIGLTVGLAFATETDAVRFDGIGAMLFYLAIYCVATAGAFAALTYLGSEDGAGGSAQSGPAYSGIARSNGIARSDISTIDDLAGVGRTRPLAGIALSILMFSLAGVPPLAGFWGKFTLFGSAVGIEPSHRLWPWFIALAVIGVLNAAIAAAYYLRIIAAMYFRPALATPPAMGGRGAWVAMLACSLLVLGLGLFPGQLIRGANHASEAVQLSRPAGSLPSSGEFRRAEKADTARRKTASAE